VSGENANLSLGALCASYVFVAEKFHSLTRREYSELPAAGSRSIPLVSIQIRPARLEEYWSMLLY
jgi:hypothetical protein